VRVQVVLVSADLTIVSRVQGACTKLAATLRTVSNLEQAVAAMDSKAAEIVILDLSTPQLDVDAVVIAARPDAASAAKVVAFGPHVHAERLAAAQRAGCDDVVSRGQFFAQLDAILERWTSK
jgi:DNA-binding NarL/FixJ family response regulator